MKPVLFTLCLFICGLSFGQLTFEQVASPNDFNISAVRKSPIGEYFIQASNDYKSIYSSMNGQDWTKSTLPVYIGLEDIQFFSDGTPLLKSEYSDHIIRRNGSWYTMNLTGGQNGLRASYIKGDTLFVYQDQTFAYSLDKGNTFTTDFVAFENIVASATHLFKYGSFYLLYYFEEGYHISIFNKVGFRVLYLDLDLGLIHITYTCDQVLFNDSDNFYLFAGPTFSSGSASSLFPVPIDSADLLADNGHWYLRDNNTIYKTDGCDFNVFNWEIVANDDLFGSMDYFWVSSQGDYFLNNYKRDYFLEQTNGTGNWEENQPNINYAFLEDVDESAQHKQVVLTSNDLFHKTTTDADWIKTDSIGLTNYQVQYAPGGALYIKRDTDILYSLDNGANFSIIPLPAAENPPADYSMEVLKDDALFVIDKNSQRSFYSLNNGEDWIQAEYGFFAYNPLIRMVDHTIIIADLVDFFEIATFNVATGEKTYVDLGTFGTYTSFSGVIEADGTIYFYGFDITGAYPEGLFRYRVGEGLEFLGQFDGFYNSTSLASVGSDLFGFEPDHYYAFDGQSIDTLNYVGLPSVHGTQFMLSSNDYVYAIQNVHTLYRSTKPLSYPQYISGTVYHDAIPDCLEDTLDATLRYWKVKVEGNDYLRIKTTDSEGNFKFFVPDGQYTVSSQPLNSNWDLCEDAYPVSIDANQLTAKQDFLAVGLSSCAELEIDFSASRLRRCFPNTYFITVHNTGPESSAGTTLTLKLDPFFEITSATIPYTLVGDSILIFDLGVLQVNDQVSFQIYFTISCEATLGMEHCLSGTLTDDNICSGDRSSYTECQHNVGSIDPNDKRIFNQAGVETDRVEKGEYVYYQIRFQNTGTDTAFRVRIVDPLSSKLDLSSIEVLSASNVYDYVITDGPALSVTFDHILLPDSSTNEAASHGYLKFRVKPLAEYDYGTSIPNQANIYFDFNSPVETNEATMVIQHPVGTHEIVESMDFELFPNPTNHELYITASENDLHRIGAYEVCDPFGQLVLQSNYVSGKSINVDRLVAGIYNLCIIENARVIGMKKFVKL